MTSTIDSITNTVHNTLYGHNKFAKALATVERKIKVKREYIAYALSGFLLLCIFFNWGSFVSNTIGFLYPAYASVLAVESPCSKDDTKWLMYWVVYALFGFFEFFSNALFGWLPFYHFYKIAVLVWLMVPGEYGGTQFLYFRFVRPFVVQNQNLIDDSINKAKDTFNHVVKDQTANFISSKLNQHEE